MEHQPTYELKRKCQQCGKPIADHEHGLRKHCPRVVLPDGRIVNCKDNFHSLRNKSVNKTFSYMAREQKLYYMRLSQLFANEGDKVTIEQINRYGINLYRPFQFDIINKNRFIFYYHELAIEQLADDTYKIIKHGLF